MTHVVSQINPQQGIDREKVCPLLLRIFVSNGRHNLSSDYNNGSTPSNELQIYTWLDCTLRELSDLIKDVNTDSRKRGTEFRFCVVTPHPRSSRFVLNDIGIVTNNERGPDDNKTLSSSSFAVGDYIDVAIVLPGSSQSSYRNGADRRYSGSFSDRNNRDRPGNRRFVYRD
ncbi:putative Sin3 associated polypeptide p18 [Aphelenchoides bicaudatus]|nr:putative Sin3 associated polypeptide p18 [Aphelenchoides bicaudatus]